MSKLRSLLLVVMLGLMNAVTASAQAPQKPGSLPDLSTYQGYTGIMAVIMFLINTILLISGSVAVLMLIISGFQFILSGANEDLAKRGKTGIKNAIIGLIIVILSYTVVRVVTSTLVGP